MRVRYDEHVRWLVVERGPVAIVCNLDDQARRVPLEFEHYRLLLTNSGEIQPGHRSILLAAEGVAVVERDPPRRSPPRP